MKSEFSVSARVSSIPGSFDDMKLLAFFFLSSFLLPYTRLFVPATSTADHPISDGIKKGNREDLIKNSPCLVAAWLKPILHAKRI